VIGSDISLRAIETASKNMNFAELNKFQDILSDAQTEKEVISDPVIFSEHWPNSS